MSIREEEIGNLQAPPADGVVFLDFLANRRGADL